MVMAKVSKSYFAGNATKVIYYGIVSSFAAILAGSWFHLAYTFGLNEPKDTLGVIQYILAFGVEAGLLGVSYGIAIRRRTKEKVGSLYFFLLIFAAINFWSNTIFGLISTGVYSSLAEETKRQITIANIVILSSSLPALGVSLTELISIFFMKMKSEEAAKKLADDKVRRAEAKKIAREERKAQRLGREERSELKPEKIELVKEEKEKPIRERVKKERPQVHKLPSDDTSLSEPPRKRVPPDDISAVMAAADQQSTGLQVPLK